MTDRPIDDQDNVAHLSALLSLAGDGQVINASVEELRNAAKKYSDYELTRFAQLIILYEHPPGELREELLTEVMDRDGAIKEIVMSIDHSWIPSEVENEVFVDEFRNEVIRSYPNPNRIGCPNESALRRVVLGKNNEYSDSEALKEHTLACGPCMRQMCVFLKEKARLGSPNT